ncbi:MAG: hypothetical protein DRH56_09785, partial [Deltaproteobacteria bacterium]
MLTFAGTPLKRIPCFIELTDYAERTRAGAFSPAVRTRKEHDAMIGEIVTRCFRPSPLRVFLRKKMPYGIDPWNDVARLSKSRPVRVAFDVGANVGQTARAFVRYFPRAEVFSFEPVPDTFDILKRKTRRLRRVKVYRIAFGDGHRKEKMYIYGKASPFNSFVRDAPFMAYSPKPATTSDVEMVTIDSFSEENGIHRIDLLKVDTEGFDIQVLRGARMLFEKKAVGFVFFEFNEITPMDNATGGVFLEMYEFLSGYGFRLVAIYT